MQSMSSEAERLHYALDRYEQNGDSSQLDSLILDGAGALPFSSFDPGGLTASINSLQRIPLSLSFDTSHTFLGVGGGPPDCYDAVNQQHHHHHHHSAQQQHQQQQAQLQQQQLQAQQHAQEQHQQQQQHLQHQQQQHHHHHHHHHHQHHPQHDEQGQPRQMDDDDDGDLDDRHRMRCSSNSAEYVSASELLSSLSSARFTDDQLASFNLPSPAPRQPHDLQSKGGFHQNRGGHHFGGHEHLFDDHYDARPASSSNHRRPKSQHEGKGLGALYDAVPHDLSDDDENNINRNNMHMNNHHHQQHHHIPPAHSPDIAVVTAKNEKQRFIGAYSPVSRKKRIEVFLEKRKKRVWTRKVKYDVRKSFADTRMRVKGRFVKKEDEDLLKELISCV